jgi:hypothetical protein
MFLDILYISLTTIGIMILIQIIIFIGARVLIPPEPRIIYREVPVPVAPKVAFTEPPTIQQVSLPEYEPRQQASDSLRLDPQLPPGIQETRPPGT